MQRAVRMAGMKKGNGWISSSAKLSQENTIKISTCNFWRYCWINGTVSFVFVVVVVDFTDLAVFCYFLITLKEKKTLGSFIRENDAACWSYWNCADGTRFSALHVDFGLGRFWSRARQWHSRYRSNFISDRNSTFSDKTAFASEYVLLMTNLQRLFKLKEG